MILTGDVRERLAEMPDESVHCVVTSPPYWGLRDYGADGQLGLEETLAEYLANQVAVFREVRRVLRKDGTCWVNMGDSYFGTTTYNGGIEGLERPKYGGHDHGAVRTRHGLAAKQLIGQPWRFAFALQDDGWWLRSDIIWAKPNPMPESITDRPTKAHEYVFLLTKSARYFYDADAVREPTIKGDASAGLRNYRGVNGRAHEGQTEDDREGGRNLRDVWTIATQPYPEAHFATYPEELVKRCVLAGTSAKGCCAECGAPWVRETETEVEATQARCDGQLDDSNWRSTSGWLQGRKSVSTTGWSPTCDHDAAVEPCTVLDPYAGSGTTIAVAQQLGRQGIGIELSEEYAELARERTRDGIQTTMAV